jgi:hypothetical protein
VAVGIDAAELDIFGSTLFSLVTKLTTTSAKVRIYQLN